jgi:hypothetical protein
MFRRSRVNLPHTTHLAKRLAQHFSRQQLLHAARRHYADVRCSRLRWHYQRCTRPGNDGLHRRNHADDDLQNFRNLRWRSHLLWRSDLRRHSDVERKVPRRHSGSFWRTVRSWRSRLGRWLDWTFSVPRFTRWRRRRALKRFSTWRNRSTPSSRSRRRLIDLTPPVIEAFYSNDIGVGHALLLAKLPAEQQESALSACFKEDWSGESKPKIKRILLPVRSLQFWIEQNVLLFLKDAPFDKRDTNLVEIAGTCADCPKRTGHNKLLFSDLGKQDACTDPSCYRAKVNAHVAKQIAAKPQLVQISTAYGKPQEGSKVLPRNHYTAIRNDKPKSKEEAIRPEFKVGNFIAEAIITEGSDVGTVQNVCANPACSIHHPKAPTSRRNEGKRRTGEAAD